jgi:hypothetical protein
MWNDVYFKRIEELPDELKSDMRQLYDSSNSKEKNDALKRIADILTNKDLYTTPFIFSILVNQTMGDTRRFNWKDLEKLFNEIKQLPQPITKEKLYGVLSKYPDGLSNENVNVTEKLVYLGRPPVGNKNNKNQTLQQGSIWVGKIENNNLNKGGRRKTHKRRGKKRHTRRN